MEALRRFAGQESILSLIRELAPGALRPLGGETALRSPAPPWPWKIWLLWGMLLLGTGLLGAMAWRLYRQMEEERMSLKENESADTKEDTDDP